MALVNASPDAVARHDKQAWIDLFAEQGRVEDPVGSVSVCGRERIGRFYETFIAPNQIRFHVDSDIVCGLHVMRDLTIEIVMSASMTVRVPVHLLYELTAEAGQLKIARLAAHWELLPMLKQQLSGGLGFLGLAAASTLRMLRQLGIGGTLGFARAASSVGQPGKATVLALAEALAGRAVLASGMCNLSATARFPCRSQVVSLERFLADGGKIQLSKVLAAGRTVSATCCLQQGEREYLGVALFKFDSRRLAIDELVIYA